MILFPFTLDYTHFCLVLWGFFLDIGFGIWNFFFQCFKMSFFQPLWFLMRNLLLFEFPPPNVRWYFSYFQDFYLVLSFQKFDYDVTWLGAGMGRGLLLSVLNLFMVFCQIGELSVIISLNTFSVLLFFPFRTSMWGMLDLVL